MLESRIYRKVYVRFGERGGETYRRKTARRSATYSNHAYPNEGDMKEIISAHGMSSRMQSQQHKYHISSKHSENSQAMERLFICSRSGASAQADEMDSHSPEVTARIEDNMQALADAPLAEELDLLTCQAGMDPVKVTGFMGNKYVMLSAG